jgi:hypothetical protein
MAMLAANLIEKTPYPVSFRNIQQKQTRFLMNFAQQLAILKGIAVKELAQEQLTEAETKFLRDIVELESGQDTPATTAGILVFSIKHRKILMLGMPLSRCTYRCARPMVGDPGSVLHEGVGDVDLLMIAVDSGQDKMVYCWTRIEPL